MDLPTVSQGNSHAYRRYLRYVQIHRAGETTARLNMNGKLWNLSAGFFLPLGMTNLWPAADVAIFLFWLRKDWPVSSIRLPRLWIALALCTLAPLALAAYFDRAPIFGTVNLLVRSAILLVFLQSLVRSRSFRHFEFWSGILAFLVLQMFVAFGQIALWSYDVYPRGISRNSSIFGLSGLAFVLSPASVFAGVVESLSLSRTYLVSLFTMAVTFRKIELFFYAFVALVLIFTFSPHRILPSGILESLQTRSALNDPLTYNPQWPTKPTPEFTSNDYWRWHGVGYGNFTIVYRREIPHNIFVLSFYELGIFCIPFWSGMAFAIYRFRLWHFLPFAIAGLNTPELFAEPNGIVALACYHVSWLWLTSVRRVPFWPAENVIRLALAFRQKRA